LLNGSVTEVQFCGTLERNGQQHGLPAGEGTLTVPGTMRLRAKSPGYGPMVLSPVLDNPRLVKTVTSLSDTDLLEWKTFEQVRHQLSKVDLVFRLERE
jgi:hypothetical protein